MDGFSGFAWKRLIVALLLCTIEYALAQESRSELLEYVQQSQPFTLPKELSLPPETTAWVTRGNLAKAVGAEPIESLHLPVYVNIFPIGFDGSGNLGIKLENEQLHAWLEHLDHALPQHLVDVHMRGLTPDRQLVGKQRVEDDRHRQEAQISYRYYFRLVEVSPKVTNVVERFLRAYQRPVRPATPANQQQAASGKSINRPDPVPAVQVDATEVVIVLEDLVHYLRLDDAYNIFVLSPRANFVVPSAPAPPPPQQSADGEREEVQRTPVYGYRSGFSNEEIDVLLDPRDEELRLQLEAFKRDSNGELPSPLQTTPRRSLSAQAAAEDPQQKQQPQVQRANVTRESELWADAILKVPYTGNGQTLRAFVAQITQEAPRLLYSVISNPYVQEDCIVDNWVGNERTMFVDLSAGPVNFGPIVGGEGVRTLDSLPSLQQVFASAFASAQGAAKEGFHKAQFNWEVIEAEKAALESAVERCRATVHKDRDQEVQCKDYELKLAEILAFEKQEKRSDKKDTTFDENKPFSFFSDGHNEGHDANLESDHFLSHLSSVLSKALHHVITPAIADTHLSPANSAPGGFSERVTFHLYVLTNHYTYNPLENDFVARMKASISQLKLPSQSFSYAVHELTMSADPTLAAAFTSAMRSAVVPSLLLDGRFSAIKRLYLDSRVLEHHLTRLDMHRKAESAHPHAADGELASSVLAFTAALLTVACSDARDIPIFLFSLDYPLPVFVDKHYQSRALPSMVVAVQSKQRLWESHLTCNGKPVYWNLRDPLQSTVASIAELLAGLLPTHITQSAAHERIAQDWLWAVGANPLSMTSAGLQFSAIHADTVHRSYIVSALREATFVVNAAVRRLQAVPTTLTNEPLSRSRVVDLQRPVLPGKQAAPASSSEEETQLETDALRQAYIFVWRDIVRIQNLLMDLKFDDATLFLAPMIKHTYLFSRLADSFVARATEHECSAPTSAKALAGRFLAWRRTGIQRPMLLDSSWFLVAAVLCLGFILVRLLKRRRLKPKIN